MTDDLAVRLARLEARHDLTDLLFAYARACDDFDEAALREVITDDIVMRHDAVAPPIASADIFVAVLMASRPRLNYCQHFVTNPVVTLTGDDTAVIRASILAMHDRKIDVRARDRLVPAGGRYTMRAVRRDARWCIAAIDIEETWFDDRIGEIYEQSQV